MPDGTVAVAPAAPPLTLVTTSCRACLAVVEVPLVLFERYTAIYCELVGRGCQDLRALAAERGMIG